MRALGGRSRREGLLVAFFGYFLSLLIESAPPEALDKVASQQGVLQGVRTESPCIIK